MFKPTECLMRCPSCTYEAECEEYCPNCTTDDGDPVELIYVSESDQREEYEEEYWERVYEQRRDDELIDKYERGVTV